MNVQITDDISLPPLPAPRNAHEVGRLKKHPTGTYAADAIYSSEQMRDYARAAVLAERERMLSDEAVEAAMRMWVAATGDIAPTDPARELMRYTLQAALEVKR